MKKFIKENWFKLTIAVMIALVGFSIFYYLVIFSLKREMIISNEEKSIDKTQTIQTNEPNDIENKKNNAKNEQPTSSVLLTKIKCQEIGEKQYKDLVNKLGSYLVFNPEYTYNKRLNTCLYAGGFFGSNKADYMEMFVKDTISNKEILFYMARLENGEFIRIDMPGNTQSIPDFNAKKDLLFNE